MVKIQKTFAVFFGIAFAAVAMARDLPVGSGGKGGGYYTMVEDVLSEAWCGSDVAGSGGKTKYVLQESPQGSTENIEGMLAKKLYSGVVQSDVLAYYSAQQPDRVNQNTLGIVAGLHMEPLHLLIPKKWQPTVETDNSWISKLGNLWDSDESKPVKVGIELLNGQVIGAWGGSIVSAKAMSEAFKLNAKVINVKDKGNENLSVPLIIVAGVPSPSVEQYLATGKYRLVSIDIASAKLPYFYKPATISYNVNGADMTADTIAVQALWVAKRFRNEKKNTIAVALGECIDENMADMADDFGTSANWGSAIKIKEQGLAFNWYWFR